MKQKTNCYSSQGTLRNVPSWRASFPKWKQAVAKVRDPASKLYKTKPSSEQLFNPQVNWLASLAELLANVLTQPYENVIEYTVAEAQKNKTIAISMSSLQITSFVFKHTK